MVFTGKVSIFSSKTKGSQKRRTAHWYCCLFWSPKTNNC